MFFLFSKKKNLYKKKKQKGGVYKNHEEIHQKYVLFIYRKKEDKDLVLHISNFNNFLQLIEPSTGFE